MAIAACRAEVLVECDGSVGSSFFFSSGYLKSFGTGYATHALWLACPDHVLIYIPEGADGHLPVTS